MGSPTHETDQACAAAATAVAGFALGQSMADIAAPSRGRADAAFARQVAMYLTYAGFGMSLARVALAFGRDRSTVSHACRQIEDRRDDPAFDLWLEQLERVITEWSKIPATDRRSPRDAA